MNLGRSYSLRTKERRSVREEIESHCAVRAHKNREVGAPEKRSPMSILALLVNAHRRKC